MEDKKIIYLSPSTQDKNIGVGNYGTEEYRMNLLADALEKKLETSGKYIVYRNNEGMDLSEIIAQSNRIMPDAHIALHSNAANGKATGPETYISEAGGNSQRLAEDIYAQLLKIYYNPSAGRGVKVNNELREIREVNAPSTLIEFAFHDNPEDAKWIIGNTEKISQAIFLGIEDFFKN